jgi:hypothetical protein
MMQFSLELGLHSMMIRSLIVGPTHSIITPFVSYSLFVARHLPPLPGGEVHQLPQPVVLDTHLRLSPTCKLLKNYATGVGKQPWLICVSNDSDAGWRERKSTLETAGVRVLALDSEDVTVSGKREG